MADETKTRTSALIKDRILEDLKPILARLERPLTWAINEGLELFVASENKGVKKK